jgi:MraZ protein
VMLSGQVETKISEKHQTAFPKRFRAILGEKVVITKGPNKNLVAVAEKNWSVLLEGTEEKSFLNKNAREVQTFLLGNATEIEFDAQGRFVLPEYLRKHAHITNDIVFVGVNTYVQIWDTKLWEAYQEYLVRNIEPITEKLSGIES